MPYSPPVTAPTTPVTITTPPEPATTTPSVTSYPSSLTISSGQMASNYQPLWTLAKITFGSSKNKEQNPSVYQAVADVFSRPTTKPAGAVSTSMPQKASIIEKKSQPVDMTPSQRDRALQEVKDILSTSPQLSYSPRRNSSPVAFSRRLALKVDIPKISFSVLRKKSGEVVKSSLKKGSKSEPATPICPKFVHFDTDLEHVRFFLEAEKPQAVSCEVSSDEEESDDEELSASEEETVLTMTLPNFPRITTLHSSKLVFVESIVLSGDGRKLLGRVQVQNIAFQKTVVVRYTFDFWQSVSEIPASYSEDAKDRKDKNFDVFVFVIDLIDNSRNPIDGKTMYFAVRYNVDSRDHWDNNNGSNYQVNFKRSAPQPQRRTKSKSFQKWSSSQQLSDTKYVSSDLCRSPPSLAETPKLMETLSPAQSNKLTNRYDINLSLSAAMTKSSSQVTTPPPSEPSHPQSTASTAAQSCANNIRPHSSYFPSVYSTESFSSFFPSSCIDGMPGTKESISVTTSKHLAKTKSSCDSTKTSNPIPIPSSKPIIGSTSYYELVDRYCFYQGSPCAGSSPMFTT